MARGAGGGRPPMGPCGVPWAPLTTAPIARRRHSERQPCGESVLAVRPRCWWPLAEHGQARHLVDGGGIALGSAGWVGPSLWVDPQPYGPSVVRAFYLRGKGGLQVLEGDSPAHLGEPVLGPVPWGLGCAFTQGCTDPGLQVGG